jgi:hypothetical protein
METTGAVGEPVGALLICSCMSATFPSGDPRLTAYPLLYRRTALPSLGTKLSVEIAGRRAPRGALREVASQER